MRVISTFSDFYDSAQQYGQDMSVVYQRKTIEYDNVPDSKINPVICSLYDQVLKGTAADKYWGRNLWRDNMPRLIFGKPNNFRLSTGKVVFCGKLYGYIKMVRDVDGMTPTASTHVFYDARSLMDFCHKNYIKIDEKHDRWSKHSIRAMMTNYFDDIGHLSADWLIENKVICAGVTKNKVVVNPVLKDVQFFKVMDAYTAYQELDMWISGTLSYPQNTMVELDDKSMIAKHGFDKWSFRKQPEGYGK